MLRIGFQSIKFSSITYYRLFSEAEYAEARLGILEETSPLSVPTLAAPTYTSDSLRNDSIYHSGREAFQFTCYPFSLNKRMENLGMDESACGILRSPWGPEGTRGFTKSNWISTSKTGLLKQPNRRYLSSSVSFLLPSAVWFVTSNFPLLPGFLFLHLSTFFFSFVLRNVRVGACECTVQDLNYNIFIYKILSEFISCIS